MPLLAERGARAVALDLPGHGLSDKPTDARMYTLDAQVESVLSTMDALGVQRAALVGHSMGGPICARLAVLAPDRVEALGLLAPAGFGSEWTLRIGALLTPRIVAPLLPYMVPRWAIWLVLSLSYGWLYRPTRSDIDQYWAPTQFKAFTRAMWDLLHCFDWAVGDDAGFETITAPAAVFGGAEDNFVVRRWVRCYASALKHASYTVLDGCGHLIPEEAPRAVSDAVMRLMS